MVHRANKKLSLYATYLIFDYVNIEIGGRRVLFSLSSQKCSQSRHVEIKKCDLSSSLRGISEKHQQSKINLTAFKRNHSHRDELSVGDNVFDSVRIFDAEGQLSGTGVVCQDGDNARGEREHHVATNSHLAHGLVRAAEVGVDDLVEGHG